MGLFGKKSNTKEVSGPAKFEIYMSEVLELKASVVGIKKAKELKSKICVLGMVTSGTFFAEDEVVVVSAAGETPTSLYGVYENINALSGCVKPMTVGDIIAAGNRRKGIPEGMESYIVLNIEADDFPEGRTHIIKK